MKISECMYYNQITWMQQAGYSYHQNWMRRLHSNCRWGECSTNYAGFNLWIKQCLQCIYIAVKSWINFVSFMNNLRQEYIAFTD